MHLIGKMQLSDLLLEDIFIPIPIPITIYIKLTSAQTGLPILLKLKAMTENLTSSFLAGTATANVIRTLHAQPEPEIPNTAETRGNHLRNRRPTLQRLSEDGNIVLDLEDGGQVKCH